jgi:hypothetical protein
VRHLGGEIHTFQLKAKVKQPALGTQLAQTTLDLAFKLEAGWKIPLKMEVEWLGTSRNDGFPSPCRMNRALGWNNF